MRSMVAAMDRERFGSCTNIGECEAVCPKEIRLGVIARMNRDLITATFKQPEGAAPDRLDLSRVRRTFRP